MGEKLKKNNIILNLANLLIIKNKIVIKIFYNCLKTF